MRYIHLSKILPCIIAIFIDYFGFGLIYPIIASFFTDYDTIFGSAPSLYVKDFYLGMSYFLYPFFMCFRAAFLADLSDSWGRKKILVICLLGLTLAFFIMSFGIIYQSIGIFLLGRAVSGFMAGRMPIAQAAVSDLSTKESRSLNMSLVSLFLNLGLVCGPLVGGGFSDKKLSSAFGYQTPFFISGSLALLAMLYLWFGFKEISKERLKSKGFYFFRPFTIFFKAFHNRRLMILV